MVTVTIEEAQAHLPRLIAELRPGEEVVITQENRPVARLIRESVVARGTRQPGSAAGKLTIVTEDEEHLEDFKEYMP